MRNKIKRGIENVHYALVTEAEDGSLAFGTPQRMQGAIGISLKKQGEKISLDADNIKDYFAEETNDGYDGDLEFSLVADSFRSNCLGERIDANGARVESKDDKAAPFALLFEFSGDHEKSRHVLYYCRAARPDVESVTMGKDNSAKTEKITVTARPRPDTGAIKTRCEQSQSIYSGFFTSVYEPIMDGESGEG